MDFDQNIMESTQTPQTIQTPQTKVLPNNVIGWITELCNTLVILITNYFNLLHYLIYEMMVVLGNLMSQYIQLLSHLIDRLTTYPNNFLFVLGIFITLYFVLGNKKRLK